ncbi:hypothetical protein C1646_817224 [Rhizophagus diaphanus]|nr:hypothetical protein C1646_817224 [Rhizophagus diaphanus] [Rhizophagus sp. MUCL 43196]
MKLSEKGVSFDYLWDDGMHSQLLAANHVKKGYYVRKLKESLWSTFVSKNVQQVYEDLYKPSNSDDLSSDTYITLIIKSVFASEKERTNENAIWAQSVLEVIFDEDHLSSKIDVDIDSEECECESSPKTPIDDDDEIIGVDHHIDDVYDEHMTDDNQVADLEEVADLEVVADLVKEKQ